jgi:ribosomal protein S18 acetylase RimI-like enzyme
MLIRPYEPKDATQLKACINELKRFESQFDSDYLVGTEATERLFEHLISKTIFVAETEGQVVGLISLEFQLKNDELIVRKVDTVYISDMVVLPDYRGQGIGELLIKKAEEYAKDQGIKYLKLIVFSKNQLARNLYFKMNFADYESAMLKKLD